MLLYACTSCNVTKPRTAEFWHRNKLGAQGFQAQCKLCLNERRRQHNIKLYADPVYREKRLAAKAAHYAANIEKFRAKRAEPTRNERLRAYSREYAAANAERHQENAKRWAKANPERRNAINRVGRANRRARVRAAEGSHTASDIIRILSDQGPACYWCGDDISGGKHTVDHYHPLARGGGNGPENLVMACHLCNSTKKDKLPDEFRAYLERRKAKGL